MGYEMTGAHCQNCQDKSCAATLLNDLEINMIFRSRQEKVIRKRTVFSTEGSSFSHIIYLRSGLVKEFRIRPDKQEQILQIIKSHSYLGLTSLFGDNINHYSYEALTDLTLCYIDSSVFIDLAKANGKFAYAILTSVEQDSINNFHRFINLNHKKIYGRVAEILIYFSTVIYASSKLPLPITRSELADMCGTTRESIGRAITTLKEDGILSISGKSITINDMKKLESISKLG